MTERRGQGGTEMREGERGGREIMRDKVKISHAKLKDIPLDKRMADLLCSKTVGVAGAP
jgi:hypothetical protein